MKGDFFPQSSCCFFVGCPVILQEETDYPYIYCYAEEGFLCKTPGSFCLLVQVGMERLQTSWIVSRMGCLTLIIWLFGDALSFKLTSPEVF